VCAAPMAVTSAGGQRAGGDALAAWAEGLAGCGGRGSRLHFLTDTSWYQLDMDYIPG
jgi:hypothetical protein